MSCALIHGFLRSCLYHGRVVCVDVGSAASGFGWPSTGGPTGASGRIMAGVSPAGGLLPPSGILVSLSPPREVCSPVPESY